MNRLSIIASLVAFAIFATLLMFLTALVTTMLGSTFTLPAVPGSNAGHQMT